MQSKNVKITVFVPESHADMVRQAMGDAGAWKIGKYSHCSFSTKGIGRFKPLEGAKPMIGAVDKYEQVVEERIEFVCARENLEKVVAELHSALRAGGYLVANEYVGPKYQQLGVRQQEIVNAAKHLLPPELRKKISSAKTCGNSAMSKAARYVVRRLSHYGSGQVYETLWEMPTVEAFLSTDPSECVSSDRIIPILRNYFHNLEIKYFNGSILLYALDTEFYDNFNPGNAKHHAALQMLFELEDLFAAAGELSQDNAHIICQKAVDGKSIEGVR